jgi:hypothetical protein
MSLCIALGMANPRLVIAGCKSDCRDEYEADVRSCKSMHGDDPEDAASMKSCIDSAKSDFDSCEDECDS